MVEIEEEGRPVDESEVVQLERALGTQLPDSYRRFLMRTNGGIPTPDVIDIVGMPGSPTDVQVFFGIDRGVESSNLLWNFRLLSRRIPNCRILPIGCDSGGNIFCLELTGNDAGNVMYFALGKSDATLYFVATSFEAFLEKIRSWGDGT
jgi:cell wall assembly regulator SMI1